MWLLAIKAMSADRGKLLTALLGVTFAVVLVNMQGGLLLGLIRKAGMLVEHGGADIWVVHRHMNNLEMGDLISERWIHRVRSVHGVERAEPYIVGFSNMIMPDGTFQVVLVIGCEPSSLMGNAWDMAEGDPAAIRDPEGIFVDESDLSRLGNVKLGDIREVNGQRARIVGITRNVVGFTFNPYVFTTLERARTKYAVNFPSDKVCFFLVKSRPGVDRRALVQDIQREVPDLAVYEDRTYRLMCMEYWLTKTGIGISFSMAAFLGLLVGLAMVAQTLSASVTERIKEFATLKALGADPRCVGRFLLAQALGSALFGSVVGLMISLVLARVLSTPRSPVELTWWIVLLSLVLIVLVCLVASWLPYWRIRRIDPASVLRS